MVLNGCVSCDTGYTILFKLITQSFNIVIGYSYVPNGQIYISYQKEETKADLRRKISSNSLWLWCILSLLQESA